MNIKLNQSKVKSGSIIEITGSKSESNRWLLLQALFPEIEIINLSNSDDTQLMQKALTGSSKVINIGHAGTAMRFLTAYFSTQAEQEIILTGSKRMHQRPIKVLVEALQELDADISYLNQNGYPPLKIKGKQISNKEVSMLANVSSQYISALLLIGPRLKNGLELTLEGEMTSVPYINMTLGLLNEIGIDTFFEENLIKVFPLKSLADQKIITVESDWSSASYLYSMIALSDIGTEITLSYFKKNSLQGDSILSNIFNEFGVETSFKNNSINLKKIKEHLFSSVQYQLNDAPDLAQTIAVTCLGLGISCQLNGLHTLKIKETDRLNALKNEMRKLGAEVTISEDSLTLNSAFSLNANIAIDTYHDHRMAMAFAPLALRTSIQINDADVVSKSYPEFWNDLSNIGFTLSH